MDEECLRPGDSSDITMLNKLDKNLSYHKHFISHKKADIKLQKIMGRDVNHLYLIFSIKIHNKFITGIPFNSLRWSCNLQR